MACSLAQLCTMKLVFSRGLGNKSDILTRKENLTVDGLEVFFIYYQGPILITYVTLCSETVEKCRNWID